MDLFVISRFERLLLLTLSKNKLHPLIDVFASILTKFSRRHIYTRVLWWFSRPRKKQMKSLVIFTEKMGLTNKAKSKVWRIQSKEIFGSVQIFLLSMWHSINCDIWCPTLKILQISSYFYLAFGTFLNCPINDSMISFVRYFQDFSIFVFFFSKYGKLYNFFLL